MSRCSFVAVSHQLSGFGFVVPSRRSGRSRTRPPPAARIPVAQR
ncbi:MAG: hypothetical protein AVDCRST_MAG49-2182 [uncultured Thermomicrobiales bacterium]|uniref:Uncharacterized protein n=1 Tax=uncultured Thermomicrobiales bacterium TaxID=1645740 RepID=A0A6J4UPN5_9BACT|nr:MAG: hypothetical protein AVDCRST_MAG49-2182 [uncultured Thermomicrobiales bacterium]